MKTYLFVVAHPDDEILGSYGTIMRLKKSGNRIIVLTFSQSSRTRENNLREKQLEIHDKIGVDVSYQLDYEMMKFGEYDRYGMTKDIENVIIKERPDVIFTHDENDIHNDHRVIHDITIEAAKLPFRGIVDCGRISSIYTMEILSSSDWGKGFNPNAFFEITEESIKTKTELLKIYDGVLRRSPHPRNYETFKGLARVRGAQCGCEYAEGFRKSFEFISR